ncbi:MAG TPA: metallophosphoesterase [Pyrinomonadaceae bacterium]|nr:metallophosphoesterase [Pyrinomonadaceae bacterium]
MLRIAHISDLHIKHPDVGREPPTPLQWLAKVAAKEVGFSVEAEGHSEDKLAALSNVLRMLKPDVIVVTGDITDYGDEKSFALAAEYLAALKDAAGAERVICIPGNHDALFERAADIKKSWWGRRLLRATRHLDFHMSILDDGEEHHFSKEVGARIREGASPVLLANFESWRTAANFDAVDPSSPVYVDAGWGDVAFFLFNSTNDPGVMANEGRIGQAQFNQLNRCLQNSETMRRCASALRVALLHHHPISAPNARDTAVNRGYDWMKDGPLFLEYMNRHNFHFVLHGHQHEPFYCSINYRPAGSALRIVAAGSAMQGSDPRTGSFNLLDLLTPFQARLCRYDYSETGYEAHPSVDALLPVRPLDEVRVTPVGSPETVDDWAMRGLVSGAYKAAYDLDAAHAYEELEYNVVVTKEELYRAEYRRRGRVVSREPSEGPVFIISGSPARKREQLELSATDNLTGKGITPFVLVDEPNRKVVRVRTRRQLEEGDTFDITLRFQWQATDSEPNHFDGLNLMYLHPDKHYDREHDTKHLRVARMLRYSVTLPWEPMQPSVRGHGIKDEVIELKDEEVEALPPAEDGGETRYRFSFGIEEPPPIAFLINFAPPPADG